MPRPKKSKVKIPIEKEGALSKHGYKMRDPAKKRRQALKKAVQFSSKNKVSKRLLALQVFNKNDDPDLSQIARSDRDWIRTNVHPSSIRNR